jgi:hypothetical protein
MTLLLCAQICVCVPFFSDRRNGKNVKVDLGFISFCCLKQYEQGDYEGRMALELSLS